MLGEFFGESLSIGLSYLFQTIGLWAPFVLGYFAWKGWMHYIHLSYVTNLKWSLLEVRLPKDVFKSPAAMELVFVNAFYQTGGVGTWYHKYWLGNLPTWFSLEIVSIEGKVHFFIRTQEKFKSIIESQIYSQYPQAEITEAPDYTAQVPPHTKDGEWSMYGCEFKLKKEDAIPIKTYVDFGLDKAVGSLDEEQRIDPITSTLEMLGSMKEGEQFWIQILIRPANWARYPAPGHWFKKQKWQDIGRAKIEELKAKVKPKAPGEQPARLTKGEQDVITAIEKSITKYGFDFGIRTIYLAKKDVFDPNRISPLTGLMRQYNSMDLNEFAGANYTGFDYPWQDLTGNRTLKLKKELLSAYRDRGYFYPPYNHVGHGMFAGHRTPSVLTTEELATIYHFPGRVSETPSFQRIEAKKSEPPSSLPI